MSAWNDWLLTAARVAIHRPTLTAVLSDLHLGYAQARRRSGEAVPVISLEESLAPLVGLVRELSLRRVLIAGDLFEAGPDEGLANRLVQLLNAAGVEDLMIIAGNHDGDLPRRPAGLNVTTDPICLDRWQIIHGNGPLPETPVVQGHLHPCFSADPGMRGAPCYLAQPGHLILPAYSAEAAGLDVSRHLEWADYHCWAVVAGQVLNFGRLGALATKRAGR